jgi:hypothetical protein
MVVSKLDSSIIRLDTGEQSDAIQRYLFQERAGIRSRKATRSPLKARRAIRRGLT